MEFRSPLSQRIILSFVLLTGIVSGLFTLGLNATINYVEESLITTELQKDFDRVIEDYKNGQELRLDEGSSFFTAGPTLPGYLRALAAGYNEIKVEDRAFFVYHVREGNNSYFLVKDQTAFENGESLLHTAIFSGFALSIASSFVLGLFMVKQVIAPLRKLTRQVVEREDGRTVLPPFSADYADDEVGALARAFDGTIGRLQQALQRETLFTSDVSHELRTPLMVINSSCDVLIARNELDDYTRQRIASIGRAANELKGLIDTFLALARGKGGHAETVTLSALVREEFPAWAQLAAAKGNRLRLQKAPGMAQTAKTYPAILLATVLGNLIRNAIHHTAGGEIVLFLRPDGFDLRDNGAGIAADERAQVFQPFYRGPASHREGLGLGLSLVQRICEREGWEIALEENPPTGCYFRINLV